MNKSILLISIVLLAFFLRFLHLGDVPPELNWDEVAWGYNAYSLSTDLRDEFGKFLPITYLESYGDFKPPVYAYLDIIPATLFGLTAFATRFPSAFFGSLTVLVSYFLVINLFPKSNRREWYGLATALFVAITPWHINLSRAAFEANVASFFIILGVTLFLYAMRKNPWLLALSAASFALTLYIFNTPRIVSPLLVLLLALSSYKELWNKKKQVVMALVVGLLITLPTVPFLLSPQASLRFREVNIFSDPDVVAISNQGIANDNNSYLSKAIHNRRVLYSLSYVKHYFDNFSPDFLFIHGDGNPKFSTQDVGELYIWDLPFFIAGIFLLAKRKEGKWWFVFLWLIAGIIPAATARETPHALRILTTLPTFHILIAYGFVTSAFFAKERIKQWRTVVTVTLVILLVNCLYYLHGYYTTYPYLYSGEWQAPYKESVAYVASVKDTYDQINITRKLGRPYMYYLFYTKEDPRIFRQTAIIARDPFGFVDVKGYDKYRFADDVFTIPTDSKKVLYVTQPGEVPETATIQKQFPLLNGQIGLVAFTVDQLPTKQATESAGKKR